MEGLAVALPADMRPTLVAWLGGTRHEKIASDAKLLPLYAEQPPAAHQAARKRRLAPLEASMLSNFELQPMAAPPAPSASAGPVDSRRRIWELTHQIHDAFTGQWPHGWERPAFASDPNNPTPDEYMGCAEMLRNNGKNTKLTLERWRDATETPPATRDALSELIDKMGEYVQARNKQRRMQAQQQQQVRAAQERQDQERRAEQARLDKWHEVVRPCNEEVQRLQDELEALQNAKRKDSMAIMELRNQIMHATNRQHAAQQEWQRWCSLQHSGALPPPADGHGTVAAGSAPQHAGASIGPPHSARGRGR